MAQRLDDDRVVSSSSDVRRDGRDGHPIARMLLPFAVGLLLGWGINEMTDNDVDSRAVNPTMGTTETIPPAGTTDTITPAPTTDTVPSPTTTD